MRLFTIGFTKWTAQDFFQALRENGIRRLIDVRLSNTSQLAGFSKRDDLSYFLRTILDVEYTHEPLLAPTRDLLNEYRQKRLDWDEYALRFLQLLEARGVERLYDPSAFDHPTVLLCSEWSQERCHRRLIVEYLNNKWGPLISSPIC